MSGMEQEGGPHQTDRGKEVRDADGHFSLSQPPHCPRIPPGDGEGLGLLAAPHVPVKGWGGVAGAQTGKTTPLAPLYPELSAFPVPIPPPPCHPSHSTLSCLRGRGPAGVS